MRQFNVRGKYIDEETIDLLIDAGYACLVEVGDDDYDCIREGIPEKLDLYERVDLDRCTHNYSESYLARDEADAKNVARQWLDGVFVELVAIPRQG